MSSPARMPFAVIAEAKNHAGYDHGCADEKALRYISKSMQKSALHMWKLWSIRGQCTMNRFNTTTRTNTRLLKELISSGYGGMVTERLEEGLGWLFDYLHV